MNDICIICRQWMYVLDRPYDIDELNKEVSTAVVRLCSTFFSAKCYASEQSKWYIRNLFRTNTNSVPLKSAMKMSMYRPSFYFNFYKLC